MRKWESIPGCYHKVWSAAHANIDQTRRRHDELTINTTLAMGGESWRKMRKVSWSHRNKVNDIKTFSYHFIEPCCSTNPPQIALEKGANKTLKLSLYCLPICLSLFHTLWSCEPRDLYGAKYCIIFHIGSPRFGLRLGPTPTVRRNHPSDWTCCLGEGQKKILLVFTCLAQSCFFNWKVDSRS